MATLILNSFCFRNLFLIKALVQENLEEEDEIVEDTEEEWVPSEDCKVYVGNLPYDVDSAQLAGMFVEAGVVEQAELEAVNRVELKVSSILTRNAVFVLQGARALVAQSADSESTSPASSTEYEQMKLYSTSHLLQLLKSCIDEA
ncbi:hypothetical protein POM88_033451 [Heracleum sosnowskyi]|uniref:RRM domain-containing protein n=1 Tax=Heracleum sosnowskyi TaxID=360622 RepID=A0AAD8I239_9APIA|nr:hypothetical protein POM88_033451 [Heracleum sosnowskyi]